MDVLQAFLQRTESHPYDASCSDDMTHAFAPVRGRYHALDDGRVGVSWIDIDGKYLRRPDGTHTEFYEASAFWDAIEHLGLLLVESVSRHGGVVIVRGLDANHLGGVIDAIRELSDLFAQDAARPAR